MDKIDRIIGIVRALKEEMGAAAVSGAPTNSTNQPGGPVNIAGLPPDSPPVDLRRRGQRNWNPFFKDLARVLKRNSKKKKRKKNK
jgi:hypothetical protein